MLYSAKARAKKAGVPFDLSASDITIPDLCPVFGTKLERGTGQDSPTLDRVAPHLGYVRGNVMVMSRRANTMKCDATAAQLRAFAEWVLRC